MGRKILVVDDEAVLVETIAYNLEQAGYQVITAADGASALEVARRDSPDLIILDIMLPEMDGLEVCRQLRRDGGTTATPIIMLTAKGDEIDKVVGLEVGADDYVTKPFGMEELLARVHANLRRTRTEESELGPIETGDFKIDPGARSVFVKDRAVHLTPKEFDLLVYLARHAGKVLTHRALLGAVWGGQSTEQVEYLRVFVAQLRKKLEPTPNSPRYIVTDPWVGYRFEPGD